MKTLFLHSAILSGVKELATFGGDITKMVPSEIVETVLERIRRKWPMQDNQWKTKAIGRIQELILEIDDLMENTIV